MSFLFFNIQIKIEKHKLENKPQNIFNADETGFDTCRGREEVLSKKGLLFTSKYAVHILIRSLNKVTATYWDC